MRGLRNTRALRRCATVATAAGAALALSLGLATSASASGKYIDLSGNVVFYENQPHSWPSATTHLDWQSDGNLVLYCNNGHAIWASNTRYHGDNEFVQFTGGQIAIYAHELLGGEEGWFRQWHAPGANNLSFAYVQDDNNFVVYNAGGGVGWASNTYHACG